MRTILPLLLPVAVACEAVDDLERDPNALAARALADGPYAVGYAQTEITYTAPTGDRTLPVEIWYPAPAGSLGSPATYLVSGVAEVDAPLALEGPGVADDGPFPVALYSHGSGGIGLLAYPYAERMASHGWIVVGPDHVGNTTLDLLFGSEDPFLANALHRPLDVSAVLDAVDAGLPGLQGAADVSRTFVFGHSFGGYTTLSAGGAALAVELYDAACTPESTDEDCVLLRTPGVREAFTQGFGDPRVLALAPQAPALVQAFGEGDLAGFQTPTLLLSGSRDRTTPDEQEAEPAWEALDDPRDVWVRLPNGAHYSFITICDDVGIELVRQFQPDAIEDGCGPDFVATSQVIPVMAAYQLAFANAHVLGWPEWATVLDLPPLHPGLRLRRH